MNIPLESMWEPSQEPPLQEIIGSEWDTLTMLSVLNNPSFYAPEIYDDLLNRPVVAGSQMQKTLDRSVAAWVRMTKRIHEIGDKGFLTFRKRDDGRISSAFMKNPAPLPEQKDDAHWIGAFKASNQTIIAAPPELIGGHILAGMNNFDNIRRYAPDDVWFSLYQPQMPVVVAGNHVAELFEMAGDEKCLELRPVSGIGSPIPFIGNEHRIFPALAWVDVPKKEKEAKKERNGLKELKGMIFNRHKFRLEDTPIASYLKLQLINSAG